MKKILFLFLPLVAFADTCRLEQVGGGDWRIVCEGSGLQLNYVDVTNELYIIQNCESLKSTLLDVVGNNYRLAQDAESQIRTTFANLGQIQPYLSTPASTNAFNATIDSLEIVEAKVGYVTSTMAPLDSENVDSLYSLVNGIQCGSCPTNGASGGGSGGSCCDVEFTDIIDRLIVAEQQRAVISNQIARISNYLGVVTNQLAYNNFLVEHGFDSVTNLLYSTDELDENVLDVFYYNWLSQNGSLDNSMFSYYMDGFTSVADLLRIINYNIAEELPSLNNYNYNWQYRIFPQFTNQFSSYRRDFSDYSNEATNFFSFFRGEIGVRGVLEDWQSEEVSGTYYDFLTNHYLSVVFGESLSGYQAEKTNWFSRIETLLAALVFVDGSETNVYQSASEASSNSVSNAKDSFNSVFDGVSSAPSTQMELAVDIEKSMYNSLKSFSQAFSSASLPSTVRLLYVYKDGGGGGSLRKGSLRSSGGSVDVSVDVDGKLSDFIEILRSCSTLCWVFFGLWFMFKFTVWTVKKIYFLIRYIIDFFNMVAGGK